MTTNVTKYAVLFNEKAYYAAKQPRYDWSLTEDIYEAHLYSTRDAAQSRVEWGLELIDSTIKSARVVEVTVKTTITITARGK